MHIVYLTPDFIDDMGPTTGLPQYLFRVASALVKEGHKVSIITCSNRTVDYMFYGINVYRVRRPRIKRYNNQEEDTYADCYRDGYILNKKLHELYGKENVDIVQYASLKGLGYFHDLPIPSVMRLSSYACMWLVKDRQDVQNVYAEMERKAALKCNSVFGPSHVVAQKLQTDINRHVEVIETPFVMETENVDFTLYNTILKGKRYVLFFGTIIEHKGLGVIEKAVYKMLSSNSDISLAIIGDGDIELVNRIKESAGELADRVIYHEAVGFEKLKSIIQNAEVVILPSLMENFSNACLEAMALGQIVVGTNGASFEQLIEDGISGFLCELGDAESLGRKVDEALSLSDKERGRIIMNAKKRIERLAPEYVVQDLLKYYQKVIGGYSVNFCSRKGEMIEDENQSSCDSI